MSHTLVGCPYFRRGIWLERSYRRRLNTWPPGGAKMLDGIKAGTAGGTGDGVRPVKRRRWRGMVPQSLTVHAAE
jgi:hypothetical protein